MSTTFNDVQADSSAQPPNVILIVSDYMGYSDIGPYGADDVSTPALDRLAREGTKFTDFYAAAPICAPSRAALLTGLYPPRVGVTRNPAGDEDGLSTAHSTLARWLKGAGYATALFGKWHLGSRPEFSPNAHGFDEFLGFHTWTIGYYTHRTANGEAGLYQNHCPVERDGYLTDILTDEAVEFIDRNAERPFFLYLAYNTALPPYQPPDLPEHAWESGWNVNEARRQDYVGMVEAMDAGIGRVLASLDAQGLNERTLVIFTYDHGGRHLVRSHPLFHGFATLWEGGIRVPMILRGPGRIPTNHTSSQPAISMDITATILDFVSRDDLIPALDGISLLPVLRGEQEYGERPLFWRTNYPNLSRQKAVRQGRWKYLVDGDGGTQFLFNLELDIGERRNLFYLHPNVVAELRAVLGAWEASLTDDPKRMVERGYDQVAHDYARLEGETEWPRMRWLKKLLNRLEPGSSVLDLGCGSGDPADVEISKERRVTGVDISQTQIDLARQNVPAGYFIHGDAGSVEFPAASFDAVVSFYTLEHIPRREHGTILRRIHQWLRAEGLLLISLEAGDYDDVVGEWLGVPMFISCFDPETMRQMVSEAGFELLESTIETQVEQGVDVPFLWLFARKGR